MSTEDDVREIALALPETTEKAAWGMPTFRVRNKIFASLSPSHGPGIRISQEERSGLVRADPAKFYWTDHDAKFGMMRLHLEAIETDELRELLTDAWRLVAGPRLSGKYPI
jgi:hypothetical protein